MWADTKGWLHPVQASVVIRRARGMTDAPGSDRGVSMNQIFFASKRAFHGVLRVMRKPLRSLGLTAARFDMLFALMGGGPEQARFGKTQSELRRSLGVC